MRAHMIQRKLSINNSQLSYGSYKSMTELQNSLKFLLITKYILFKHYMYTECVLHASNFLFLILHKMKEIHQPTPIASITVWKTESHNTA